jgi:hypothetical protein
LFICSHYQKHFSCFEFRCKEWFFFLTLHKAWKWKWKWKRKRRWN